MRGRYHFFRTALGGVNGHWLKKCPVIILTVVRGKYPVTKTWNGQRVVVETSFSFVIAMVKARLREAAATLKRMKLEKWDYPSQRTAWWPDVVRHASDAYGYHEPDLPAEVLDRAAIDRMEEVLGWLLWLENGSQRLVWARASKLTWRQLETADGRSRETLRKEHDKALAVIVEHLAEGKAA